MDRLSGFLAVDRMPTADAAAWAQARSVRDLGQLGARWLEGDLRSQPAYAPGCGPDEETLPYVPILAAANRAGFYTTGSEAPDAGVPGLRVNTSVNGFCDDDVVYRMEDLLRGSGLRWSAQSGWTGVEWSENLRRGWWWGYSETDIRSFWQVCHPTAVETLVHGWQVCVEDPEPGREDVLWPLLAGFGGVR